MVNFEGDIVPLELCTMTNPETSGGESYADDCDTCGDCSGENCDTCIVSKIFKEYARLTGQC